ncbi:hypothetical protein A5700_23175 [Mycobacterium sp. E1214]|nr:hypothetical protein A5700_23175 [Mycobacterium sp. E1214]OBH27686.1 hypothetical protein A5693_23015 [Mycobacterium sp. E1319]
MVMGGPPWTRAVRSGPVAFAGRGATKVSRGNTVMRSRIMLRRFRTGRSEKGGSRCVVCGA